MSFLCLVFCVLLSSFAVANVIPDQIYGYVDVREGAHMFWWFYGSTNPSLNRSKLPLILWLQGGPGAGGSGYGNFGEIGSLNSTLLPREFAWTKKVNLLFIDNPVGAGYSYVDNMSLLTTDVQQISSDLLICHQILIEKHLPFMSALPYWIFSESYGGKMTAHFGNVLYDAIGNSSIKMDFRGVVLQDSWISGISYVNTWPSYLYALTLIDNHQYQELLNTANDCQIAVNENNWENATSIWGNMEEQIEIYTNYVDFYFVLDFDLDSAFTANTANTDSPVAVLKYHHLQYFEKYLNKNMVGGGVNESQIFYIMNGEIKEQLGIPSSVIWGSQSDEVFDAQSIDFMKPVVDEVDLLLKRKIDVNVWNGQLDLICCTLGTLEWIQTLNYSFASDFHKSEKIGIQNPSGTDILYFKKAYANMHMYYMMDAGHMVPADNPMAAMMAMCDVVDVAF